MTTEAEVIAALAEKSFHQPVIVKNTAGREFLIMPPTFFHKDVSEPHQVDSLLPEFIRQSVTLFTADSFIDYLEKFQTNDTLLFGDSERHLITACIDYHSPGEPSRLSHAAMLQLRPAEEWKLWTGISGKMMPQHAFAVFLEENAADISYPEGAAIIEAVRDIQAHREMKCARAVRTNSGTERFLYSDETKATSRDGVEIPTSFELSIPIYFGGHPHAVKAFLRWEFKSDEGKLNLGIALHRAEHVRQAAFRKIMETVEEETKLTLLFGSL